MNKTSATTQALPLRMQLAYAAPAPALALIGTAFYVFIPKWRSGWRGAILSRVECTPNCAE